MNAKTGIGLFLWEGFALASAIAIACPDPTSTFDSALFTRAFFGISCLGWALVFLVVGLLDHAKRR